MEVKQSQVDSLIDDISYLEHEADALKYVIDSVPYDEAPENGRSISEILMYLDHAQQNYYRKVIEDAYKNIRPINLNAYSKPEETFEVDKELAKNVQKLLYKISKHRVALLKLVEDIALIDWEREISKGKETITLFDFVYHMVRVERSTLKDIADFIMTYQKKGPAQNEVESQNAEK